MSERTPQDRAIEELEQLGLREYEAKCFAALTEIQTGTAREVSEQVDMPRTRVYEAARSLESQGLVEIQHSSPQRFRALSIRETVEVLENRYRSRIEALERSLEQIKESGDTAHFETDPEVWSLVGSNAITTRAKRLIDDATTEALLLIGDRGAFSDGLSDRLLSASDRDVDVVVGTGGDILPDRFTEGLSGSVVFDSDLEWLHRHDDRHSASIGKLLLVDNEYLLASTICRSNGAVREHAVCGNGTNNGLVLTLRQLLLYRFGI